MCCIIVCDSDPNMFQYMDSLLISYLLTHPDEHFTVKMFSSAFEVLDYAEVNHQENIYLLDIHLPKINGVQLGQQIRTIDNAGIIIYITASKEHAFDSFCTKPFSYLLKPLDVDLFIQTLDDALKMLERQKDSLFPVKSKSGLLSIRKNSIVSIEYRNHRIIVNCITGTPIESTTSRIPFRKWIEPLLNCENFICPHKSYLVNLSHVHILDHNKTFIMRTDQVIPISSGSFAKVKQYYARFLEHSL